MTPVSAFVRRGQELIQQLADATDEAEKASLRSQIREHVLSGVKAPSHDPKMKQAGRDE